MPRTFGEPDTKIKIMSALSYLTGGIAGLIYVLARGPNNESYFFRFHFFQAILLGIFVMLLTGAAGSLASIFAGFLGFVCQMLHLGESAPDMVVGGFDILGKIANAVFFIAMLAGVVQSLRGKFLDIPFVGNIARQNLR